MDHLDPKPSGFVIYLVLRMHQFQKYRLLSILKRREEYLFMKKDTNLSKLGFTT
jgi:hypothetical protein